MISRNPNTDFTYRPNRPGTTGSSTPRLPGVIRGGDRPTDVFDKNEYSDSVALDEAIGQYSSITMPDGSVLYNPFMLTPEEYQYYLGYVNGKFYLLPNDKRKAEAAYNKYQQMVQWFNDQQNNEFQTDWNSETNQILREMKAQVAAGLNPDLMGLSGGAAADMQSNQPSGMVDVGSSGSDLSEVLGYVGTVIQAGSTIASAVYGGMSTFSAVRSANFANSAVILDKILPFAINNLPDEAFSSQENFSSAFNSDVLKGLGLSKSDFSRLSSMLKGLNLSPAVLRDYYNNRALAEDSRQTLGEFLLNPARWDGTVADQTLSNLLEYRYSDELYRLRADMFQNLYRGTTYENADGSLAGDALDASSRKQITESQRADLDLMDFLMRTSAIWPLLRSAKDNIESGDPYRVYLGKQQLAQAINPQSSMWSTINGIIEYLAPASSGGSAFLSEISDSVSGALGGVSQVLNTFNKFMSGDFSSVFGFNFNDLKTFFHELDQGIEVQLTSVWDQLKSSWSDYKLQLKQGITPRSSSNPIDTPLDSFDHFR